MQNVFQTHPYPFIHNEAMITDKHPKEYSKFLQPNRYRYAYK